MSEINRSQQLKHECGQDLTQGWPRPISDEGLEESLQTQMGPLRQRSILLLF